MRFARLVLAPFVACLCGAVLISAKSAGTSQSFPLSSGTYWIYQGLVRWQEEGSTVGEVRDVTWKMSVVRTLHRNGLLVAVISGFPSDLDWSVGKAKPTPSILVETQDADVYRISSADVPSIVDQIDNPQYGWRDLLRKDERFLQFPLKVAARFGCDEGAEIREDGKYCWVVGPPHQASLQNVKGVVSKQGIAYQLEYDTNPDDEEFEFVPGVGITSYGYHHHGTIADTELHLVEFHLAN